MSQHTEPRSANTSPTMRVDVGGTRFAYREFGSSTGGGAEILMTRPLTSSIEIAKPPENLWILLTTVGEIADWYDNWDAVDNYGPGEFLRVGSTFRLIHRSRDESAWCRVEVADAPHRLRWIEVANSRAAVAVEFYLEPDETGGTVLTHTKTVIGPEVSARYVSEWCSDETR